MDAKLTLSILREHSEYVGQLATKLTATLRQLERTCLAAEAEMFCKRLELFLEQTQTANADATEMSQNTSSV
jgi:hypothetical protein